MAAILGTHKVAAILISEASLSLLHSLLLISILVYSFLISPAGTELPIFSRVFLAVRDAPKLSHLC